MKTAGGVTYTYDGDGRRVEKSNGKLYWYGTDGNVLDETDATGSMTNSAFNEYIYFAGKKIARRDATGNVFYYSQDMLGSSVAMVEKAAGQTTAAVCYDADFYPYGSESNVTNTCPQNYKWTGKERDAETGNDDFDARYYSSVYGRFLSADWSAVPAPVPYANLTNPQTLNLYAIVRDNPESYADLDGHCVWDLCVGEGAALYAAAAATFAAVAYLETPQGKEQTRQAILGAGLLINKAVQAAESTVLHSESKPGTLGKPDHQATVQQEADRIKGKPEQKIPTPEGKKDSRRADAVGTNPKTGKPEIVQVYRPTPAGNVPQREKDAAEDIRNATGVAPTMVPVRPVPPPPPIFRPENLAP